MWPKCGIINFNLAFFSPNLTFQKNPLYVSTKEIKSAATRPKDRRNDRMQELNNHFSTLRNAKVSAFKWATNQEIPFHYLDRLQKYCVNSMEMLDYKKIDDEKEYEMYGKSKGTLLPLIPLHLKKLDHLQMRDVDLESFTEKVWWRRFDGNSFHGKDRVSAVWW